jgi:transposase
VSNVLSEEKKQQVLALGRLGWTLRRIERETKVRRETASAYLRAAGIDIRAPGRWGRPPTSKPAIEVITDPSTAKPANEEAVFTDSGAPSVADKPAEPQRSPSASACEPYRDAIELGLSKGRNTVAIYQELVDTYNFAGSYQSVRRFVTKLRGSSYPEPCGVIVTSPGEEAQVDYGTGPMVRDAATGKYRRTRLFVMTLGYSRKSVRFLVFRSSSRIWAEFHEKAFRRLGGAPKVVILDNLREGVLKPDIYDPKLNPLYSDLLKHYGAVALPCRIQDPDRKGKVESGVGHAQRTPLKGLRFESLESAQSYLDRWEERWADTRIHGTTKRQVAGMFAEEKPTLTPLPIEPFRHYEYGKRTVHPDGCIEVEAAYYSTPPGWIGREVQAQWDGLHVRIIDPRNGLLLREHLRQQRGRHRVAPQDEPRKTPLTTSVLLNRTQKAGRHIGSLCQAMYSRQGQVSIRRIMGVLRLAKQYGAAVVDDACAVTLDLGNGEYPFLRRYLERQPAFPLTLKQVDPLIRQLELYRDVIDERTQQDLSQGDES